jgi:hypothetical protein
MNEALGTRYDDAVNALIQVGLTEEATALRGAQVGGQEARRLDDILCDARGQLIALRRARNAGDIGFATTIQSALDRLGHLWAVVETEPPPPLDVKCTRCGSLPGKPCFSVGQDSYCRGAPLTRAHPERCRASKARARGL